MNTPDIRHVTVRGRQLAVQVRGTGPAVVMEMGGGFGGIGPFWRVDGELAKFSRVVTYDRAGLGGSDRIGGHPTMGERAQDLAALLDALDIREPVLFAGWSLGGLILLNFTARYPERVGGLLLIDPTPPDMLEHAGPMKRWAFSAALGCLNRINLLLASSGFFGTRAGAKLLRKQASAQFGLHMPSQYEERILEAMARPPAHRALMLEAGRLPDICRETLKLIVDRGLPPVPTIVLSATHRPSLPEKMRTGMHKRLRELMPAAEVRELPEIGHMIPAEDPDSVIQGVRDLLARMQGDHKTARSKASTRQESQT